MRFGALLAALALPAALAQGDVVLWHGFEDAQRVTWIEARVEAYNDDLEERGREERVVAERAPARDALSAAVTAAEDGVPPHLVQVAAVDGQRALDTGIFQSFDRVQPVERETFVAPLLHARTIDGAVQAIPWTNASPLLFANEQALRDVGLDPADLPNTFGELLDACAAVAAEAEVTARCLAFPLDGWLFEQWIADQGALLANAGNGREGRATEVLLTSQAAMTIGEFLRMLGEAGHITGADRRADWSGAESAFTAGNAVFLFGSSARTRAVVGEALRRGVQASTGPLPTPDGAERPGPMIDGESLWLTAGHPQPQLEIARDFALYLVSAENTASWHRLTGDYPVRTASLALLEQEGWFEEHPQLIPAVDRLLAAVPDRTSAGPLLGTRRETRVYVEEALRRVYEGTATVEEALSEAKRRADAALAEYNQDHF